MRSGAAPAVLLVALVAACACPARPSPPPESDPRTETPSLAQVAHDAAGEVAEAESASPTRGAALYTRYCAFCHGAAGEGYVADHANALASPTFLATARDAFLRGAIVYGRPGTPMSAWGQSVGGPLSDADVEALVAHLRAWQAAPTVALEDRASTGSALRGRAAYDANCAACHGTSGAGVVAPGIANPRFLASASDSYLRYAIRHGRPGTPMPAWEGVLRDQVVDDLVALIRSWETPVALPPVAALSSDLSVAVLNPGGPRPVFTLREDRYVPADEVAAALRDGQSLVLLDARARTDFALDHITGAVNLPFYEAPELVGGVPRGAWIITYCGCPHAVSGQLADALRAAGFGDVAVLDEGFHVWKQRGYPVTVP